MKKEGNEDFDVPMGCYDGAEICQLVGTYILSKLKNLIDKKEVGLYRDDGLGILRNMSGPEKDRMRKKIIKVFKDCGLSITIEINVFIVDFLDTQFNLKTNTYKPYRKPNNEPMYINQNSNHPPTVLKQLPKSIEKRISELSSDEKIFNDNIKTYENALKTSGFKEKLNYIKQQPENTERREEDKKRRRKIIWFNPPFSINIRTNIGQQFFKLLNKHFPKENSLHKIFNKNTVKLSYSCTRNMGSIISAHNKHVLRAKEETHGCNCRSRNQCPLNNECLTPGIVYQAEVTNNADEEKKIYIGLTENKFKERYRNHTKSFRNKIYATETELSKYIWELKDQQKEPSLKWSILKKVNNKASNGSCKLCLTEKLYIIRSLDNEKLLNTRSELVSKYRHINKSLLRFYKFDSND